MTGQKKQEIDEMTADERKNCRDNWNGWLESGELYQDEVETAQAIVAYIDSIEA